MLRYHNKHFKIKEGQSVTAVPIAPYLRCDCNGKPSCVHEGECTNDANWAIHRGMFTFFLACDTCFDYHCPPSATKKGN